MTWKGKKHRKRQRRRHTRRKKHRQILRKRKIHTKRQRMAPRRGKIKAQSKRQKKIQPETDKETTKGPHKEAYKEIERKNCKEATISKRTGQRKRGRTRPTDREGENCFSSNIWLLTLTGPKIITIIKIKAIACLVHRCVCTQFRQKIQRTNHHQTSFLNAQPTKLRSKTVGTKSNPQTERNGGQPCSVCVYNIVYHIDCTVSI